MDYRWNSICKEVKDGGDATTTLKIISAHNNDYTSAYTQSVHEKDS